MTDLNSVFLIGRVTRTLGEDERSFGYIGNGTAKAEVSIAVNRSRKNGNEWVEEVNYFNVTIWGKQAENLKPYLKKGQQICVSGFLKQDRWEKDGKKNSRVSIIAERVWLTGGKKEGELPPSQPMNAVSSSGNFGSYEEPSFPEDIPF